MFTKEERIQIALGTMAVCSHCKEGILRLVKGTFPYDSDKWQCDKCDSTYIK